MDDHDIHVGFEGLNDPVETIHVLCLAEELDLTFIPQTENERLITKVFRSSL